MNPIRSSLNRIYRGVGFSSTSDCDMSGDVAAAISRNKSNLDLNDVMRSSKKL
jgi:hypothetical protein